MAQDFLKQLVDEKLVGFTARRIDVKHLLSAERAARGSFYATRVGFVAVNPKGHRIARAHNGFPAGITETRERWSKTQKDFYHLHAECAGVFQALRMGYSCLNATAYITHPPCPGCAHLLVKAGFARVVFSEQALAERLDWREDILESLKLLQKSRLAVFVYRDRERAVKNADITRTELDLKKIYDALVPEARWSSNVSSAISRTTKPESAVWADHPVITILLAAAREGIALAGKGVVMDHAPECRTATALVQAGARHIIVMARGAPDPRWAVATELEKAAMILAEAGIRIDPAPRLEEELRNVYLDATLDGLGAHQLPTIRPFVL